MWNYFYIIEFNYFITFVNNLLLTLFIFIHYFKFSKSNIQDENTFNPFKHVSKFDLICKKNCPKKLYSLFWKWLNDPFKFIDSKSRLVGLSTFLMSVKINFFQIWQKFQFHTLKDFLKILAKHSEKSPTWYLFVIFQLMKLCSKTCLQKLSHESYTWEMVSIVQCRP